MMIILPEVQKSDLGTKTYVFRQAGGTLYFRALKDLVSFQLQNQEYLQTVGEYLERNSVYCA